MVRQAPGTDHQADGWRPAIPLVIDRNSLGAVLKRGPRAVPTSVPILIDDPSLTSVQRAEWESRLSRLYNECGCHEGALGLLAAFPVLLALFLWRQPGFGLLDPGGIALLVALPLLGAIAGKLLGLAVGRLRLRRAVAELSALIEARSRSIASKRDA
jgi:hypothetical protein